MDSVCSPAAIDPARFHDTFPRCYVSLILILFDKSGDAAIRVGRVGARSLLWIAGVRVTVEGLEKVDSRGSYVLCSNHLSYMDTPAVLGSIPANFLFLAKKGLFQIPFLGTHLKQAGHIPVPRQDPRAAVKTMNLAAQVIRERRISMLIFPEGGRSHGGILQPFKEGGAYIAIKAQVPLLPIALVGTRTVLAMGSAVFHPFQRVTLRIGDPLPTAALTPRHRDQLHADARHQLA